MFTLFSAGLAAQTSVTVSGNVRDDSNRPVEQATVLILNPSDSANITGALTDNAGKFSLKIPAGNYLLKTSSLGYSTDLRRIAALQSQNTVDTVVLTEGVALDTAFITGIMPEMVVRGDTIEFNASAFKTLPSAVLEDLIKKLPGAEVDDDGKITVNGKEIKKIYVDKKEFFSDDPKVASKNLPAAMVDKVQVWDKKSDLAMMTGFDDDEEETVINLTVKPGMKQGLFGSVAAGAGSKERYEINAMANYMHNNSQLTLLGGGNNTNNMGFSDFATSAFGGSRPSFGGMGFGGRNNGILRSLNGGLNFATETSSKFKIGGNLRYGNTNNDVTADSYTQNYIASGDQFETRNSAGRNVGNNLNAGLRMEWKPDENTTIIFSPSLRRNGNNNRQSSIFRTTRDDPADSINWGEATYSSEGSQLNLNGTLDVSRKLSKTGRTLSASLSGGFSNQDSDGFNDSRTFYKNKPAVITDQIFNTVNNSYNWRGYLSYVEPLGKNNFMQLSYSYRENHSKQDRKTYKNDGFDNYDLVDSAATRLLVNDFVNQEIRLNFQSIREKYQYTIGIAAQPSKTESRTTEPDTAYTVSNNVVNFAPIMQFIYRWDRQTTLRINYNGQVSQPSATQLSSARDESNPLNISYGNPDLRPSFNSRLRIQFQKSNTQRTSTMTVAANAGYTGNDIVRYSLVDSLGKRESTYRNVDGNWNADLRFMLNRQLFNRKLSLNTTSNLRYSADNSFVNGLQNTARDLTLSERLGATYRSDLFDFGLNGNLTYTETKNTISGQNNRNVFNYGGRANTTIYLPWSWSIESDMNYSANSGYSDGYKQNEWLWNATISKQLFAKKNATLKLTMYDILRQRSNISRTSSSQSLAYTATNTISSYVIVSFVYRFQHFKKGTSQSDFRGPGGRRESDGERPQGPPSGGGGNFGGGFGPPM
jgi:hypothetical protein